MQQKKTKKLLSFILSMMLIVAMALCTTGCNGKEEKEDSKTVGTEAENQSESNVLGEGKTEFTFCVVDQDGNETQFEIHTDEETVGAALLDLGLIAGDEGEYGLYVKEVNGITADYDIDGTYWAFYVNGEYAQSGVDTTAVTEGDTYSFKVEK